MDITTIQRRLLRKILWLAGGALVFCLAALLAAALAFLVQYRRDDHVIALPPPRGPHAVGRMVLDWQDSARHRELMLFIWYPAAPGTTGHSCEYIPGKWGELEAQGMLPIPARRLEAIQVSAMENAPPASAMRVLVLLPGMGRIPAHYTSFAEDLASYGYLVLGVTPTGSALPAVVFSDGHQTAGAAEVDFSNRAAAQRLVETWGGDASFALDQLTRDPHFAGRLPVGKVGIFGHSFGGNVALHLVGTDARFRRGANLDGSLYGDPLPPTDKPVLILDAPTIDTEWERLCASGHATCAAFPHALHMDFSDAAVFPSRFPIPKSVLLLGDIDGRAFLRDISDRLRGFFDQM